MVKSPFLITTSSNGFRNVSIGHVSLRGCDISFFLEGGLYTHFQVFLGFLPSTVAGRDDWRPIVFSESPRSSEI